MMTPEQEKTVERVREYLARDKGEGEQIASLLYVWMAGTRTYFDDGRKVTEPTGEHAEKLIEAAETDPAAWEAARMLVAGLSENGESIPSALLKFTGETMRGHRPKPTGGRPKHKNLARDLYIANAVYMLLKAGFQKTQNDETPSRKSAFSIVAGFSSLSYGAVRTVWKNHGDHIIATRSKGPMYFIEDGPKLKL